MIIIIVKIDLIKIVIYNELIFFLCIWLILFRRDIIRIYMLLRYKNIILLRIKKSFMKIIGL